jgi:lipopolysaccharide transport system permease protein
MEIKFFMLQIVDLTVASLKSRYRKTFAGFIWVIMNPLLMFGVQSLVFKKFLKVNVPDYSIFLLSGLLPWIFFTQTIQMGTPVFVSQSQLLRSFKINPMVIVGSQILDNFINFLLSFLVILIPFYIYSSRPLELLVLLPLAIIPLAIGTMSLTIILSILNVFFRDINYVVGFIFNLFFFITPIFYPIEFIPENWRWLTYFNPIAYFLEPFRCVLYQGANGFILSLAKGFLVSSFLMVLACIIWKRKKNDFYYRL